jgi:MinD-like ATPase involved in chromosome partitioning or flagellar assembly
MALANTAVLLARRGKRVLAVDWDLEAPGLPRHFASLKLEQEGRGLLPFVMQRQDNDGIESYRAYLGQVTDPESEKSFEVLPSGHETDPEYSNNLERFNWHDFFQKGGGDFFEKLRIEWKAKYDVVLIDSRTGLTDTGGICTIQLPDIVVAMFTANYQSLYGVRDVMRLVQQSRQRLSFERMSLTIIPLPSRFGTRSEFRESKKWLDEFVSAVGEFFMDWLPLSANPRMVLERMKIPQVDYFSFGERLAVVEDSNANPEGMTSPYNMIADLIESDLSNLSAILPPESWETTGQTEKPPRPRSDQ